jgi:hypothetical protein
MKRLLLAYIALIICTLTGCSGNTVDTTPPVISTFTMPATAAGLEVAVTSFEGMDGSVPCAGYMITETDTPPLADDPRWLPTEQASFTFSSTGEKTAYAWAKDAAGNVSVAATAHVTITLADTTPPTIISFTMPATATALTVAVTTFTATDNVGVTGFMITEVNSTPLVDDAGWTETAPTSFTFSSAGQKTAYAWAKDAAGNIWLVSQTNVTVQLTAAVLKISTAGTDTSLSGVGITVSLPAGVTVKTDAGGAVDPSVVTVSGVAVPSTLIAPLYTPATATTNATLTFAVASNVAGGFNVGEFATVTCDITPGVFPRAAEFTLSGLNPGDLFLQPVTGLTPSMLVELR